VPLTQYWTCFNGPVDPFWCENLNTVLDDSKVLCLSNGERIKLHDEMRIILECENLKVVSPATISRCGVIYITDHMVEQNNYIDSFFDFELKTDFK
jgi:dynein heavy chain